MHSSRLKSHVSSLSSSSCGSRTRLCALKGRYPQTDRRTSHDQLRHAAHDQRQCPAYLPRRRTLSRRAEFTQWTGRCSNPRLLVFSQVLNRLSYQSNKSNKKPGVVRDTGLSVFFGNRYGQVSRAQWIEMVRIRRLAGDRTIRSSLFAT